MADFHGNQRLDYRSISAVLPGWDASPLTPRIIIGGSPLILDTTIYWVTHGWSSFEATTLVLIGVALSVFLGVKSNGLLLLWLWSETVVKPPKLQFIWPPESWDDMPIPASDIVPGDWICDCDVHEHNKQGVSAYNLRIREVYERQENERLAHLDEWRIHRDIGLVAGLPPKGLTVKADPPDYLPLPERYGYQVVAKVTLPDHVIGLGLVGKGDLQTARFEKLYYRARPKWTDRPGDDLGDIIKDLIEFLVANKGHARERVLVAHLARNGYGALSVLTAVRNTLAVGLIERKTLPGQHTEAITILDQRNTLGGHECCMINLTGLGRVFYLAGRPAENQTSVIHQEVIMGDKYNVQGAAAVGRHAAAHDVTINQYHQGGQVVDLAVLAKELARLREKIANDQNPERAKNIRHLASAQAAVEKGDERSAIAHLAQTSKWVLNTAMAIGTEVAAAVIARAVTGKL
jgi:hypothetical protein